jgi:hypothetical protein
VIRWHVWWLLVAAAFLAACAPYPDANLASPAARGDTTTESPAAWSGVTLHVPGDFPTIQAAVDAAGPGDLILVEAGTYKETVRVTTAGLTIRGVDRNAVVIDGEFERANGFEIFEDGVVVENMTSMNHKLNGFYWSGVRGYRGSYLTAINNGDYGIYAFDSGDGVFEHSYASGSPDAAFYIGQCNPCDGLLRDVVGEHSGLGYSGSNSSDVVIVESVFRHNATGLAPNSFDGELLPPVERNTLVGNLIYDSGYLPFPFKRAQWTAQGYGIAIPGVIDSLIARNRIVNSGVTGITLFPFVDANVWMARNNRVIDNVVDGVFLAELNLGGPSGPDNCFEGNDPSFTMPPLLEQKQPCDGFRFPALWELGSLSGQFGRLIEFNLGIPDEVDYADMPHPPDQPQMPGGADAEVIPAVDVFSTHVPNIDEIGLPDMPDDLQVTQEKGFDLMGVTFASTIGGVIGLYAYVLPLVLYAAWVVIALWELFHSESSKGRVIGWTFAILIIPFLGAIAYYIFGRSQIPAAYRWVLVAGGMGVYALFLALGLVVGGLV